MAGSEVQKGAPERQIDCQDGSKDAATAACDKLRAGSFDYPKTAQLSATDKGTPGGETQKGKFEDQTFDIKSAATPVEIEVERRLDHARLRIDPKDKSSETFFDKMAESAVRTYKFKMSPDYRAEMRKTYGLTDQEFHDPAKVREAQINYQRKVLGMPKASLSELETRMHLVNVAIKKGLLYTPADVD